VKATKQKEERRKKLQEKAKKLQILTRKSSGGHQGKRRQRKKPELEEHKGMPQRQHFSLAKRRGDRNPKYHEEKRILPSLKTVKGSKVLLKYY
jgi:hypothetical protein